VQLEWGTEFVPQRILWSYSQPMLSIGFHLAWAADYFFSKVYAITAYLSPMHLACIYEWSLKPWELATLILSGFTIVVCYFYSFMS